MGLDNPLHIAFLVVILLLVFGARRLPEIGRSLGSGMREFKTSVTGDQSEIGQHQSQSTLPANAPQQTPAQQAQPAQVPVVEPVAAPMGPPEHPPAS